MSSEKKKGIWRTAGSGIAGAVILTGGLIFHIVMPDQDTSEMERRRLAQLPEISVSGIESGIFMDDFETYLEDQFPARQTFRQMRTWVWDWIYMMQDNHGVFVKWGEYAARRQEKLSMRAVERFAAIVNEVRTKYPDLASIRVAIIPDKEEYLRASDEYCTFDYNKMMSYLRENLKSTQVMDLIGEIDRDSYYTTDIHLSQEGSLNIASLLLEELGAGEIPDWGSWERHEIPDFYGSLYGQAALSMDPDTIVYMTSEATQQAEVWHLETDTVTPVYDLDKLTDEKSLDKYDIFLSGPDAYQVITSPAASGDRELIVFRDSFAGTIVPLMLNNYSRITVIDLRYIPLLEVFDRIDAAGKDVLFLYNAQSVNQSMGLRLR